MIINSIIAGGGSGVDIHFQTFKPTQAMTLAEFFTTYDVRLHYKNSIMYFYTHTYNASGLSSAYRMNYLTLCNASNFSQDYLNFALVRSAQTTYNWYNIVSSGSKLNVAHSDFSADAITGRISCSSTITHIFCDDGTMVAVWEIPVPPQNTAELVIDTTPWGTT